MTEVPDMRYRFSVLNKLCSDLKRELKANWASHFLTLIIGLFLLLIGYLIVTSVIISGHKYEISKVFTQKEIFDQVISQPIEILTGGGYFSIGFRVSSENEKNKIIIKYEISFDGDNWVKRVTSGASGSILNEEVLTSTWYYCPFDPAPVPYIRFVVSLDNIDRAKEGQKIDLLICKHM